MNIRNRLLLFFILIVFIPISIILVAYNRSALIIRQKINNSLRNNLDMIEVNIMQKFDVINDLLTYIYMNTDLVEILSLELRTYDSFASNVDIINEIKTIDKILGNYELSGITGTSIYPKIYMVNRPEYIQYSFSNKVFDLSLIETEKWYLNLPFAAKYTVVGLNKKQQTTDSTYTIRIAKKLFGIKHRDIPYSALLTIDIGIKDFINILDKFKPSGNSEIFILDDNFQVIVSPNEDIVGKDLYNYKNIDIDANMLKSGMGNSWFTQKINDKESLIAYKKIDELNWTIFAICPVSELYGEVLSFKRIMYMVLVACLTLTIILALFLSENMTNPIRKLVGSMAKVKDGNFNILIDYEGNDEFSYLIKTYNNMLKEIEGLINELYISEADKREAELSALQSQINPHFLYNTLDSINWLALKHNAHDISNMVSLLSDFFRYSLSKGKNIIPLLDEIKQVESYLAIQKIRFGDKINYNINFPYEMGEFLTVKLILQPIVENSIIHGIEKKPGNGTIDISVKEADGIIKITICDNGIGADIEEMNMLLQGKRGSGKSFGIRNVNDRIKQFFGKKYGIQFYTGEISGVVALIKFPAVKTLEGLDV